MPSANTHLKVSEADFDSIKANLKTFMRSQAEFSDYDFEGSAMNILLDVLAYNTHYMAYYLNMTANEMFLDTAQLRNSIISHAKMLGYTPRSRTGAVAYVNILATPPAGNTQTTLTIPKYTQFISEAVDSVNYNFVTLDSHTATKSGDSFYYTDVPIKEGEVIAYQFTQNQNNPRQRFTIDSASIDTSTITVLVQESISNTSQETFTLNDDITELNSNSAVYFLDETENGSYTLYFGDGIFGKRLSNGNIIQVTYLDTNAEVANKANVFTIANPLGAVSNITVTTVASAAAGSDRESIEDIKFRAPIYYTTQNRVVTKNDYTLLLLRDYPNIESLSIWGGEEYETYPQYGKVFISMKPKSGYVLTTAQKEAIVNDIIRTKSVLTVTPEIVDPDYLYLKFDVSVYYDPKKTTRTADEIKTIVRQTIIDYKNQHLNTFNSVFRMSKLQYMIDQSEKSITSCDVEMYLIKQVTLVNGVTQNYEINFFSPLHRGGLQEHMVSRPTISVRDSADIARDVYFEEVLGASTGIDSIHMVASGTGYSDSPSITINGDGTGATATAKVVNGRIETITVGERGSNYTVASVTITDPTGTGASARVDLLGRYGTVRTYYLQDNGQKVIVNENAGTIDYDSGEIVLVSLTGYSVAATPYYGLAEGVFAIQIKPDHGSETLFPTKNRIITIDETDLSSIDITVHTDNHGQH